MLCQGPGTEYWGQVALGCLDSELVAWVSQGCCGMERRLWDLCRCWLRLLDDALGLFLAAGTVSTKHTGSSPAPIGPGIGPSLTVAIFRVHSMASGSRALDPVNLLKCGIRTHTMRRWHCSTKKTDVPEATRGLSGCRGSQCSNGDPASLEGAQSPHVHSR